MAFTVLFVCTANICRSAMAERLLVAALAPAAPIEVGSAGVRALSGHDIDEPSARAAAELGAWADTHSARQLTAALIGDADLVLTATEDHRAATLQQVPIAFRRTFTMREFVRLAAGLGRLDVVDVDSLRARVAAVAARRGTLTPVPPGADSIGDPYGAPWDQVQACAATIQDSVVGIVAGLGLPPAYKPRHGRTAGPPAA